MPQYQAPNPPLDFSRRRGPSAKSEDLRRAWEHLARIDILEGALAGPEFCDVSTLAVLAMGELNAGNDRTAADLLHAAEHICFAAQSSHGYAASSMRIFAELHRAIEAEFDTLIRRAEVFREQRSSPRHGEVVGVCARTLQLAREAHAEQSFSRALELARAGELLAEVAVRTSTQDAERIAS